MLICKPLQENADQLYQLFSKRGFYEFSVAFFCGVVVVYVIIAVILLHFNKIKFYYLRCYASLNRTSSNKISSLSKTGLWNTSVFTREDAAARLVSSRPTLYNKSCEIHE